MNTKTILSLFVVTAVVLAAAVWVVSSKNSASAADDDDRLFADLMDRVNDVEVIHVETADESFSARKEGDDWVIAERGGYPADFKKVKEALLGIAQLEIQEPKTKKPENHAAMGVEEPSRAGATSKRVTLRDASGADMASLVIGDTNYRRGGQTVYCRRSGEDQVYLCTGNLKVDPTPKTWMNREIVKIAGDRIEKVVVQHADGETVKVGRSPENHTQFTVENVPPGREVRSAGVANGLGTWLNNVQFEDVRPVAEVDFQAEPLARTTFRCNDGLIVAVESAKFEDETWIRFSSLYEEPNVVGPTPEPEGASDDGAEGEDDASEEQADEPEDDGEAVAQEAEELATRLAPWAFSIASYKGDNLVKRMEDYLKEPEAESEPAEPTAVGEEGLDLDSLLTPPAETAPEESGDPAAPADSPDSPESTDSTSPETGGDGSGDSTEEPAPGEAAGQTTDEVPESVPPAEEPATTTDG